MKMNSTHESAAPGLRGRMRELSVRDVIANALRRDSAGDPRSRLSDEAREALTEMLQAWPLPEPEPIAGYVVQGLRLRVDRER